MDVTKMSDMELRGLKAKIALETRRRHDDQKREAWAKVQTALMNYFDYCDEIRVIPWEDETGYQYINANCDLSEPGEIR